MLSAPRLSGVLLPLFSLRSAADAGVGDFAGLEAVFTWLKAADQKLLMLLPLLPTAPGDTSPYSPRCAFGLNPVFIHLGWLPEAVPLTDDEARVLAEAKASPTIRYDAVWRVKGQALERGFHRFATRGGLTDAGFTRFLSDNAGWLEGYALYASLSEAFGFQPWWEWPAPLARREAGPLQEARTTFERRVRYHQWLQWVAFSQWGRVRAQARAAGILLCGDEPFTVASDSSDAWQFPHLLRRDGRLGVPPDDFAADGQDWGLPWFDFEAMEREDDAWLKARAAHAAATYDLRRVDHAIGYFRQYVRDEAHPRGRFIPGEEPAQHQRGVRNFTLLGAGTQVVAEDLGVIPAFARQGLASLGIPGYQVMRWAREDGQYRNPQAYPELSVVTTGTHDTEPLHSWWRTAEGWEKDAVFRTWPLLQQHQHLRHEAFTPAVHEVLLRCALEATSRVCILPWQDVLGEEERLNTPGTVGGHNWTYRLAWEVEQLLTAQAPRERAAWLAGLTRGAGRA